MEPDSQQAVEQYLSDMITTVHGSDLDAELRKVMVTDLAERFNQRMILTVLSQLTEPEQAEFETIATAVQRHGEIEPFLRQRIPQYDELMIQTMQEFRDEYFAGSGLGTEEDASNASGEQPSAPSAPVAGS